MKALIITSCHHRAIIEHCYNFKYTSISIIFINNRDTLENQNTVIVQ